MEMPDIAGNIQGSYMRVGSDEEGEVDDEVLEWLASDTLLADIFNMLPHPKALIWGIWRRVNRNWNDLSPELQSVVKSFQCPSLTTIAITSLTDFPLSTLHVVPLVKELYVYSVQLQNDDHKRIVLPHLVVLKIGAQYHSPDPKVQLVAPNLQKHSFDDAERPCSLANRYIRGIARAALALVESQPKA